MDYIEYKQYMMDTIIKETPKYVQKNILEKIIECGIAIKGKKELEGQMKLEMKNTPIDISEYETDAIRLQACMNLDKRSIKVIEEWEFIKSYKNSAIFFYKKSLKRGLQNIIDNNHANLFSRCVNEFDNIRSVVDKPRIYKKDGNTILKFSYGRKYYDPKNGEEIKFKYPIIIIFFDELNILEIRMDTATSPFKTSNNFYMKRIKEIKQWIKKFMFLDIENINFQSIIENIKDNKKDEVMVSSQHMCLKQGGKATLNVGLNKDYDLPILGELKRLMKTHDFLFSKFDEIEEVEQIKQVLENFIEGIEKNSDLPRITLCWKQRDIVVEFVHAYKNNNFTLLQHFGEQGYMERMDYVTKYLIENRIID